MSLRRAAPFSVVFALLLAPEVYAQNADRRTGVTLFQEGTTVSASFITRERSKGGDELAERLGVLNLSYGVTPDLTLGLSLPQVDKELRLSDGTSSGDVGLGDLSLLAKYRFAKVDGPRRTFQAAAIVGVELSTGETGEEDSTGSRLPPSLQPGTGSTDPLFALAATQVLGRSFLQGSAFYKWNREGSQDFEAGNLFTLDLAGGYRFYQAKFPGPEAIASLGVTWETTGRARQDGSVLSDTGGNELFANAGVVYRPRPDFQFEVGVAVPFHQDLRGNQLETDFVAVVGIGFVF